MQWMVCAVLALVAGGACGGRLLVVFPVPGKSHGILGSSVVDILLDAGHQVTYVTPFPTESNRAGLTVADISSVLLDASGADRLDVAKMAKVQKPSQWVLQMGNIFASRALLHVAVQELLNDPKVTFDAVIADWFYSGLLAPLAAVYDCPLIWYSTGDVSWQSLRLVHEASSPAYSVDSQSLRAPAAPFSTGDKIYQLMLQMYLTGWIYYYANHIEKPAYREIFTGPLLLRGRQLPAYDTLVYNGSLLLVNSHPPLGQHVPLPRSVKYVGGHHLSATPDSLPKDLKQILDGSKHGVIYFSLGSNLKSRDLPENIIHDLVTAFGRLKQTVLWKFEDELEELPGNVHALSWAPQHTILEHPNVSLFISHGGLLSITEATHHGVPIIGIPIFGDQFVNIDQVVHAGYGIRIDFSNDLAANIVRGINEMLDNPSYRTNAKQASSVFRSRLATPQDELLHWVQLVTDTGGAGHLRSPALQMSAVERLNVDILILIVMIVWFLSKVLKVIKVHFKHTDASERLVKKED